MPTVAPRAPGLRSISGGSVGGGHLRDDVVGLAKHEGAELGLGDPDAAAPAFARAIFAVVAIVALGGLALHPRAGGVGPRLPFPPGGGVGIIAHGCYPRPQRRWVWGVPPVPGSVGRGRQTRVLQVHIFTDGTLLISAVLWVSMITLATLIFTIRTRAWV